ncbi:hypothetical protein GCM10009527_047460 [Actinomadura nitritigenes]
MDDRTGDYDPLAALGAHLSARRLQVELTTRGLKVLNPQTQGCCVESSRTSDTITCRARSEDGGTRWFYTSWREPIAPADQIIDASVRIVGYLAGTHVTARAACGPDCQDSAC